MSNNTQNVKDSANDVKNDVKDGFTTRRTRRTRLTM